MYNNDTSTRSRGPRHCCILSQYEQGIEGGGDVGRAS